MKSPARGAVAWGALFLLAGGTLSAMGATVLWVRDAVNNAYFLRATDEAQRARTALQENIDRRVRDLGALADGLTAEAGLSADRFQERAARALGEGGPVRAMDYIDSSRRVLWTFPFSPDRAGRELLGGRAAAADRAAREQRTTVTDLLDLWDGGVGVALYAPVFRNALWAGWVESTWDVFRVALGAPGLGTRYDVTFVDPAQGREYRPVESPGNAPAAYDNYFSLNLADRTWWMILHPLRPPPALAIVTAALVLEALLGGTLVYYLWRRTTP